MTLDDIRARVATVKRYADEGDFDAAHNGEDALSRDVLTVIAWGVFSGCTAHEAAAEAMRTHEIKFMRRCA